MKNNLFHYFQQEQISVGHLIEEFRRQHPLAAERLSMNQDTIEDPDVQQLFALFALSNARLQHKIDDEFPEITQPLLDVLCPHLQTAIPGMTIIQFHAGNPLKVANGKTIATQTLLNTETNEGDFYFFSTVYPVTLLPITVEHACVYETPLPAPVVSVKQAKREIVVSALALRLGCNAPGLSLSEINLQSLTFFIHAPANIAYPLYELFFDQTVAIVLGTGKDDPEPVYLELNDLIPIGFNLDEGLLPYQADTLVAQRLLTEFFSFPEKFLFFKINNLTTKIKNKFNNSQKKLHLFFYFKKSIPYLVKKISAENFRLHCTPAINLFKKTINIINCSADKANYVISLGEDISINTEIYQIDKVCIKTDQGKNLTCIPWQELHKASHPVNTLHYQIKRQPSWETGDNLKQVFSFSLQFDLQQLTNMNFKKGILQIELTCYQKNIGNSFSTNNVTIFSFAESATDTVTDIQALTPITNNHHFLLKSDKSWQQITQFFYNPNILTQIHALHDLLALYNVSESEQYRQLLASFKSLNTEKIMLRQTVSKSVPAGLNYGLKITLTIDDSLWENKNWFLFGLVLEHLLAQFISTRHFIQLIIINLETNILFTGKPLSGTKAVI